MTERLTAHLSTCKGCASELAELQREQEIYAHYQRDITVTPAQWNIVQARIEQEKDNELPERRTRLRERLGKLFSSRKQFRPAFAVALVLLVVGITAGVIYMNSRNRQTELAQIPKQSAPPSPAVVKQDSSPESNRNSGTIAGGGNQDQSNSNHQTPVVAVGEKKKTSPVANVERSVNRRSIQPARDEAAQFETTTVAADDNLMKELRRSAPNEAGDFDFEIARHAERAEVLLRSFRNVRLPANTRSLDVSYEKENARKLLYQNIALRRDAASRGDQPATEVLNTLEPILLDIANLPDRARARDVRSIEQRMEKKEIVATLQVRTLVASN
jgi:hypothetical protein